jgi:hypothetical protein
MAGGAGVETVAAGGAHRRIRECRDRKEIRAFGGLQTHEYGNEAQKKSAAF